MFVYNLYTKLIRGRLMVSPVASQTTPRRRNRNLIPELYAKLRERICLLEYPPGAVLREEALASEFGVSRTPIRSVLQRLEFDGLVETSRGTGAIVTSVDLVKLQEVYTLRLKLAGFISDMMSARRVEEQLPGLERLLENSRILSDRLDVQAIGRLYHEFHDVMTAMIHNQPLRRISDQLFHQTSRVWLQILPSLDWDEERNIVLEEMQDVYEALLARDIQAAGNIRRDHMIRLLNRISGFLGSANS